MVMLGVENESELVAVESMLAQKDDVFETFREPDMSGQMTATATIPADGKVFREFRLLKE
jgi:hypothetical protein